MERDSGQGVEVWGRVEEIQKEYAVMEDSYERRMEENRKLEERMQLLQQEVEGLETQRKELVEELAEHKVAHEFDKILHEGVFSSLDERSKQCIDSAYKQLQDTLDDVQLYSRNSHKAFIDFQKGILEALEPKSEEEIGKEEKKIETSVEMAEMEVLNLQEEISMEEGKRQQLQTQLDKALVELENERIVSDFLSEELEALYAKEEVKF